jgi:NAD(P)-dependent dehydrogenase (short-subunit alcohol dehydrogenase family)
MAKHGVLGLTKTDGATYASQGIRINCLCPGWITTPMSKGVRQNEAWVSLMLSCWFACYWIPGRALMSIVQSHA